jgi:pyruvate dehydrogenase E1 component
MKAIPDQISRWIPQRFLPLGTDGFGRSDDRPALRRFFEVDAAHVTVAALSALAEQGDLKPEVVEEAIARYEIDPDRDSPHFTP